MNYNIKMSEIMSKVKQRVLYFSNLKIEVYLDKLITSTVFSAIVETSNPGIVAKCCFGNNYNKKYDKAIITMKKEIEIYKRLQKYDSVSNMIGYYYFSKLKVYCVLFERLIPLKSLLYDTNYSNIYGYKDLSKVCLKLIESLEMLYKEKLIHNDIQPSNIMFNLRTNSITLIDFGMTYSQEYMKTKTSFKGNICYCSIKGHTSVHTRSYFDDLESMMYCMYRFILNHQLPWENEKDLRNIYKQKKTIPRENIFSNIIDIKLQKAMYNIHIYLTKSEYKKLTDPDFKFLKSLFYD